MFMNKYILCIMTELLDAKTYYFIYVIMNQHVLMCHLSKYS